MMLVKKKNKKITVDGKAKHPKSQIKGIKEIKEKLLGYKSTHH